MTDDDIQFGREGGIGTVLLNRPQALNAFTLGMYRRFDPALRAWAVDPVIQAATPSPTTSTQLTTRAVMTPTFVDLSTVSVAT